MIDFQKFVTNLNCSNKDDELCRIIEQADNQGRYWKISSMEKIQDEDEGILIAFRPIKKSGCF